MCKVMSGIIGSVLFLVLVLITESRIGERKEAERLIVAERYSNFQYEMTSLIDQKIMVMDSVIAMLNFNDMDVSDDEINAYMAWVMKEEDLVSHMHILEDTTVRWTYPEQDEIGIDMAKVKNVSYSVLKVKNEERHYLYGPVMAEDGTKGYVVQIPIWNNEKEYWGQLAFTIDAQKYNQRVRETAERGKMEIHVINQRTGAKIIENTQVLKDNPLVFSVNMECVGMDVYVTPLGGWRKYTWLFIVCIFVSLIMSIATGVSIWYNLKATQKLEKMANQDFLTGIYNRCYFEEYIKPVLEEAKKCKNHIGFILIDLNEFKKINDHYGHLVGDNVLKVVAHMLKDSCRSQDGVFRIGGDEFLVVLPRIGSSSVVQSYIHRVEEVMKKGYCYEQEVIEISMAMGYGVYPKDGRDVETVMQIADERMYKDKQERERKKNNV